uniref:Uncharacterized protein n=1 Tax=Panagrolaimus davidi TaxID=227884 RepID=A0A914P834_9BILA
MGKEEFFQSFKGITILYLSMIIYPMPSIICLLFTLDREGAIEYIKKEYPFAYELFITAPCNTFVPNKLSKTYFAIVTVQIVIMCFVVWFLFFTIRKKLYELRTTLSTQTIKARRQLLWALFLQVFLPAGLLVTPILIYIGGIILQVDLRGLLKI